MKIANVELPVTVNRELIEAPALYSNKGVAVTLLNYGEETKEAEVKEIEVTVQVDQRVQRAQTSVLDEIKFKQDGNQVTVTMPLGSADVLQLFY